jgi:hypothetical protein
MEEPRNRIGFERSHRNGGESNPMGKKSRPIGRRWVAIHSKSPFLPGLVPGVGSRERILDTRKLPKLKGLPSIRLATMFFHQVNLPSKRIANRFHVNLDEQPPNEPSDSYGHKKLCQQNVETLEQS